MIIRGQRACQMTGIPETHAVAFQAVADVTECMISTRSVGKWATGLIEEGYASKGFHNKAKSCNWGPMAGFVLADPRFSKALDIHAQARDLQNAANYGANEVPLYISDDRRRFLIANDRMRIVVETENTHYYWANSVALGRDFLFVLKRAKNLSFATGVMWSVNYAYSEGRMRWKDVQLEHALQSGSLHYLPVLAIRDPGCTIPIHDYRAATTGDYDLFAIFAQARHYRPDDLDRRLVAPRELTARIRRGDAATGEDPHLGNMTPRIRAIRDLLNRAFREAGYTGGNMVHHSDEGGRPCVTEIDLPVFAVVPGEREPYCLAEVPDLREFISDTLRGYAPVFNPGWMEGLTRVNDEFRNELIATRLTLRPPPPRA